MLDFLRELFIELNQLVDSVLLFDQKAISSFLHCFVKVVKEYYCVDDFLLLGLCLVNESPLLCIKEKLRTVFLLLFYKALRVTQKSTFVENSQILCSVYSELVVKDFDFFLGSLFQYWENFVIENLLVFVDNLFLHYL